MTLKELKGWIGKPVFLEDDEDTLYGNRWYILKYVHIIDEKDGVYSIVFKSNEVFEWYSKSYTNTNPKFKRPVGINDCVHYCYNLV